MCIITSIVWATYKFYLDIFRFKHNEDGCKYLKCYNKPIEDLQIAKMEKCWICKSNY